MIGSMKVRMKMKFAGSMLVVGCCCLFAHGAENFQITVPLLDKSAAPVVDGVIDEQEWTRSVSLAGFLTSKPVPNLTAIGGEGLARFACDGERLYLGLTFNAFNNDPGGGLTSAAKARDGAVPADDNIELLIRNTTEKTVYHIFTNPSGVIFDRLWRTDEDIDLKWNCAGLKVANEVKAKVWSCEISIPLASLGVTDGKLSINICRNSPGKGAAQLIATNDYRGGEKLDVSWAPGAPAVQMTPLGLPLEGNWAPGVRIAAAPEGRQYVTEMSLWETPDPTKEGTRLTVVPKTLSSGEISAFEFITRSREFIRFEIKVTEPGVARPLLRRMFYAKRGRQNCGVPATAEFDVGTLGSGEVFYYPGQDRARVKVYPAPKQTFAAVDVMADGKTSACERLADGAWTAIVATPKTAGNFTLGARVRKDNVWSEFPSVVKLTKRTCEWLGNSLGKDRVILPPFTPIVRQKQDGLSVLLRDYAFTGAGLPKQITALGRNLLAAPAYFEAVVAGRTAERMESAAPEIAVAADGYEATVCGCAKGGSGVELQSESRFEYDGFLRSRVSVRALAGRTLNRLTLVLPFKDEEVPLWHICTIDSIRFNPTGALPSGEGLLWDGTRLHRNSEFLANDRMYEPQAVPYLWLGAERRGLSWFLNNTCGYKFDPEKPSVRIFREKGVVRVEIDLVNRPVRLADGHSFEFGFEATPVKMASRGLERHYQDSTGRAPKGFVDRMELNYVNSGLFNQWARYPNRHDWSAYAANTRRMREGAGYTDEFRRITESVWARNAPEQKAYCSTMQMIGRETYYEWMTGMRYWADRYLAQAPANTYPMHYSDPTLTWDRDENEEAFKSEWISRPTGYIGATRNFLVPSYLDYVVWFHATEIKNGLCGIYMDDMFPMTCRNPDTSMLKDDEGRWHGNLGIFEMRELVRRVSVVQHLAGIEPRLLQVHMTNCLLVPCFAFATSTLSWEDHYGEDEFQKRFKLDYLRAESIGTQIGAEAVALDGIFRQQYDEKAWQNGRFRFLTRTQLALLLPAGVRLWQRPMAPYAGADYGVTFPVYEALSRFGFYDDDCRFVPFFENDGAISGEPDGVLVASWRKPGAVLVVYANQTEKDVTFVPELDVARLGLTSGFRSVNAETRCEQANGVVTIPAYDFVLIECAVAAEEPCTKPQSRFPCAPW